MKQLQFVDDAAIEMDLEEKLYQLMEEFGRVFRRRNLRANENKSRVIKCTEGVD